MIWSLKPASIIKGQDCGQHDHDLCLTGGKLVFRFLRTFELHCVPYSTGCRLLGQWAAFSSFVEHISHPSSYWIFSINFSSMTASSFAELLLARNKEQVCVNTVHKGGVSPSTMHTYDKLLLVAYIVYMSYVKGAVFRFGRFTLAKISGFFCSRFWISLNWKSDFTDKSWTENSCKICRLCQREIPIVNSV